MSITCKDDIVLNEKWDNCRERAEKNMGGSTYHLFKNTFTALAWTD